MVNKNEMGAEESKLDGIIEKLRTIDYFKIDHGSMYNYDENGHLSGTQVSTKGFLSVETEKRYAAQEKQDITVFVQLDEKSLDRLKATFDKRKSAAEKIYIVERQPDDAAKIIESISEVTDPENLYLGVVRDKQWVELKKATLLPTEGLNHFDWRNFEENGESAHERTLGGKVAEIVYKK